MMHINHGTRATPSSEQVLMRVLREDSSDRQCVYLSMCIFFLSFEISPHLPARNPKDDRIHAVGAAHCIPNHADLPR